MRTYKSENHWPTKVDCFSILIPVDEDLPSYGEIIVINDTHYKVFEANRMWKLLSPTKPSDNVVLITQQVQVNK